MAKVTWYDRGYQDAVGGLNCDAPMWPGHKSHENYREGYEDGQRSLDNEADFDRYSCRVRR